jgi:hypothetical protein
MAPMDEGFLVLREKIEPYYSVEEKETIQSCSFFCMFWVLIL